MPSTERCAQFALIDAIAFAARRHRGQRRKDAEASPYINHPIALAHVFAREAGVKDTEVLVGRQFDARTEMRDIGQRALDFVFEGLKIDSEWSHREERSFWWIGERLRQSITVSRGLMGEGTELFRLTAETAVVREVNADQATIDQVLCDANRFAFGSGYAYEPTERTVYATAGYSIHEQTLAWRSRQFVGYTIGQLAFVEAEAGFLAHSLGGQVAEAIHPQSGMRPYMDDMLNAMEAVIAPAGRNTSAFHDAFEFETIADVATRHRDMATVGGSADGIALECAFGASTAITVLDSLWLHRRLGSGLRVRLQLPDPIDQHSGARVVAMLNRKERAAEAARHHLGAWTVEKAPAGGLAVTYSWFIPSFQYQKGLALDCALDAMARARWADRVLNGRQSEGSAWTRLASRFGFARKQV